MSAHKKARILAIILLIAADLFGVTISQEDGATLLRFVHCTNIKCLREAESGSTHSQLVELVFYTRSIQINPLSKTAAAGLLRHIPRTVEELDLFAELSASVSPSETDSENRSLAKVYFDYPANSAKAAMREEGGMERFLVFGRIAIHDPHLDYPQQAVRLCKSHHRAFLKGFSELVPDEQLYFRTRIVNPETCHAIAKTEADE